ncbi:MAG TPA: efflux RND transporter periplasmic adaptor subunit [Verrucomicrobiae bacterium]|jgi:multidrug efflux system membrane fusion protein|nr:efflux RND transporter periplasmic adaptor subunit [Verrucomicrobiae bacterium]
MEKKDQAQAGAHNEPPSTPLPPSKQLPPAAAAPHRRRLWPWVVASIIVVLILLVIFLRRGEPKAQAGHGGRGGAGQTVVVDPATATKGDINVYVNALGTVTPYYVVSVRTRVDGQLVKVNYKEGQLVHAGDPLAEIDPSPFQATLVQARGELTRDQALLENARLDLSRYQEAFSKNAVPKQQLDTQGSTVHQFEGTVALDEGQVSNALVQLAYCYITSPINGRVGLRLVDPGNIVHASDANPLVVVTEMQPITVIFNVAEDYLPQIHEQMKQGKELAVDALDRAQLKKIASGVLETLDNQIDTTTGTLKLKAVFTNEDESLFPNQFVNARLLVDTHRGVTLLPNPVIQHNAQGAYVYVLESSGTNQTATIKSLNVVTTEGDISEVEGIEPGTVVAASNFNRLTDGAVVNVRPPGEEKQRGGSSTNASPENGTNGPARRGKKK